MSEIKLKNGHSYLIRKYSSVDKITVCEITKTSIQIKWEGGNKQWMELESFEMEYYILEDLGHADKKIYYDKFSKLKP